MIVDRFTRQHGFIHRTFAVGDHTVDWQLFSRADAQFVADVNVIERNAFFGAVSVDTFRSFGRKPEQRFDRR